MLRRHGIVLPLRAWGVSSVEHSHSKCFLGLDKDLVGRTMNVERILTPYSSPACPRTDPTHRTAMPLPYTARGILNDSPDHSSHGIRSRTGRKV